jgi:hypothetical protein
MPVITDRVNRATHRIDKQTMGAGLVDEQHEARSFCAGEWDLREVN